MKLYKFRVEAFDSDTDDFEDMGTVLLPFNASYSHTEHALQAVGVFAPRGMDCLMWGHTCRPDQYGEIFDAVGIVLVRITVEQ